ncbi:carbonic anhydrase 13-like [Lingula anatina]|uniref:Carbonic anhydrase n=1 Tax=Lingula anatina TaxID=7574 RepID=A0A1S3HHN9_LINAN|nr:carbonic anhydrase 13-like [Lingula anatina]|eukprot:XP_013385618.1 carbonic anhydrase 13-like [Lingula anatina]
MTSWGYGKKNGPATWGQSFQHAAGDCQSPIDLKDTVVDSELAARPLVFNYPTARCTNISNTGYSFKVDIDQDGDNTPYIVDNQKARTNSLSGGPLTSHFKPIQFHFHWGKEDDRGSEHTVEGQNYSAELHIVHWTKDKGASFSEAASAQGGLAVLGMLIKVGQEHSELQKSLRYCSEIKYAGDERKLADNDNMQLTALLPKNTTAYWTYSGSLTTPPCYESVNWIVFKEPIEMSRAQLDALRDLRSHKAGTCPSEDDEFCGHVVDNYRPPQPLKGRVLKCCQ